MAEHEAAMKRLLESRERRQLKRDVARLTLDEVRNELFARDLNEAGDSGTIRERLLRALMRELEPSNATIPWYADDQAVAPSASESEGVTDSASEIAEPTIVQAEVHETPRNNSNERVTTPRVAQSEIASEIVDVQAITEPTGSLSSASTYVPPASIARATPTITISTASLNLVTTTSATMYQPPIMTWSTPAITRASVQPSIFVQPNPSGFQAEYGFYAERYMHMAEYAARDVPFARPRGNAASQAAPQPAPRLRGATARLEAEAPREPLRVEKTPMASEPGLTQRFATARDWGSLSPIQNENAAELSQRDKEAYDRVAKDFARLFNQSRAQEYEENASRERLRVELAQREAELADQQREVQRLRELAAKDASERESAAKRERLEKSVQERERARESLARAEGLKRLSSLKTAKKANGSDTEAGAPKKRKSKKGGGVASIAGETKPRYDKSSSESSVESDREDRPRRPRFGRKGEAVKLLRSWGMRYAGEDREDAEEFMEQLVDCCNGAGLAEREILAALPCVLAKRAARWYRTLQSDTLTWSEFLRAFKNQFIGEYDREDLLDDLRRRTQAKGEPIAEYMSNFRYIISRFAKPPKERKLTEMAYRNLLPDYRRAMSEKVITSLAEIEDFGRRWEKQKELDSRYVPPPTADKMRVPGAAFSGTKGARRVASVETEIASAAKGELPKRNEKTRREPRAKNAGEKKGAMNPGIEPDSLHAAVVTQAPDLSKSSGFVPRQNLTPQPSSAPPPQRFVPRQSFVPPGKPLYANVARDNAPSSGPAPYSMIREAKSRNWGVAPRQLTQQPAAGYSAPVNSNVSPPPPRFVGPCFTCQAVGHRASECPDMKCYWCGQKGHSCRECPRRSQPRDVPTVTCQACGASGVTVLTCSRCAPRFTKSGNEAAGGQQ